MAKLNDLTGQRFGRLTVIEKAESNKYGHTRWLCLCDCGKQKVVYAANLVRGKSRSCGCLAVELSTERLKEIENHGNKVKNLEGKKYGRLTVIKQCGTNQYNNSLWLCKCECGNEKIVSSGHLAGGTVQSCGCLKERQRQAVTKHGRHNTKLYSKWQSMKTRCENPKAVNYGDYGGRGIRICEEWENDFLAFYSWAISNGYEEGLTLDRIDVNGNYEPSNCRWATIEEQNNNQRKSRKLTYNGKTQTIGQWAKETGINYQTIRARIDLQHWSVEKALTTKTH